MPNPKQLKIKLLSSRAKIGPGGMPFSQLAGHEVDEPFDIALRMVDMNQADPVGWNRDEFGKPRTVNADAYAVLAVTRQESKQAKVELEESKAREAKLAAENAQLKEMLRIGNEATSANRPVGKTTQEVERGLSEDDLDDQSKPDAPRSQIPSTNDLQKDSESNSDNDSLASRGELSAENPIFDAGTDEALLANEFTTVQQVRDFVDSDRDLTALSGIGKSRAKRILEQLKK